MTPGVRADLVTLSVAVSEVADVCLIINAAIVRAVDKEGSLVASIVDGVGDELVVVV